MTFFEWLVMWHTYADRDGHYVLPDCMNYTNIWRVAARQCNWMEADYVLKQLSKGGL